MNAKICYSFRLLQLLGIDDCSVLKNSDVHTCGRSFIVSRYIIRMHHCRWLFCRLKCFHNQLVDYVRVRNVVQQGDQMFGENAQKNSVPRFLMKEMEPSNMSYNFKKYSVIQIPLFGFSGS